MNNTILFNTPTGARIFNNIMLAFFKEYSANPAIKNMHVFLENRGWPCKSIECTVLDNIVDKMCYGLEFADSEALTAFILHWG